MAVDAERMPAPRRQPPAPAAELADLFRNLVKALFDSYRPERHYMRGPGPKWRAKHAAAAVVLETTAITVLVPVRIKR